MRREATTAIPEVTAIGGGIATGSKGSAVAVQGSPSRWRAGRAPEFGSSARIVQRVDTTAMSRYAQGRESKMSGLKNRWLDDV